MCVIIHRPKDAKEILERHLKTIIRMNDDGWGISYFKDGHVRVAKSMAMIDSIETIRELEKENIEFLFHARFATHGDTNLANCHPFQIKDGFLFHNGKINVHCRSNKMSDTFYFASKVSKFLRKNKSIDFIIEKFSKEIGKSRLAIMWNSGEVVKFGDWDEEDGCYYSKINWKYGNYTSGCGGQYGGYWDGYRDNYAYIDIATKHREQEKRYSDLIAGSFKEMLEGCARGEILITHQLKKLSVHELLVLAINFPETCAQVLDRGSLTR